MILRSALTSIFILFASTFWGQTTSPAPLTFNGGFFGGATLSQVHGDGIGGFNKAGFHSGVVVEISRENRMLQLGVVYNQKGSRRPPNPTAGDYDTWAYKFTYIDLPVVMHYEYDGYQFMVGLQPSYLMKGQENFFGAYTPTTLPLNEWDLSGVLGMRMPYGEKSHVFMKFTQSIIAICPAPDSPITVWDNKMMNMTLELGTVILIR